MTRILIRNGTLLTLDPQLGELFNAVTTSPAAEEFYARVGGEAFAGTPESLSKLIEADIPNWGRLVKAAGIEPE